MDPSFRVALPDVSGWEGGDVLSFPIGRRKRVREFVSRPDLSFAATGQREEVRKSQENICVFLRI